MSNKKGELVESLQAGTSWLNAYQNTNTETGHKYHITVLNHSYQDRQTGDWIATDRYSISELIDLHCLTGEMLNRLRVKDHSITKEKENEPKQDNKQEEPKGKFTRKEATKRAAKKAAKKTANEREVE